ncbi:uncharacterized protein LOC114535856 [Dendronephthya gigantea]|uniref:uncharacterized protein LOC114535856 n=1 Tax=Dendronephthya gigantea TaxID=151771 RepID=UPI00106D568E|nr:uncharacterized protein LOC114535856 [Dendronephthya gigantea]
MYNGVCKFQILWLTLLIMFMETVQPAPKDHTFSKENHTFSKEDLKEKTSYFNSDEHDLIGSSVTLPDIAGNILTLPNDVNVQFSKIVALAGDFYGVPSAPIIDPKADASNPEEIQDRRERFMAAYETLAVKTGKDVVAEVNKLVNMIDEDNKARDSGGTLHTDADWDRATGGTWAGGLPLRMGSMLSLATKNFDHFQPQAAQAWLTGHELAIEKAREAAKDTNQQTSLLKLMEAYAMDAFASHFLTDIFSAGHLRTPRVALHYQVTPSKVGDYLSKFMHDEDCKYGLRVTNKRGDKWIAYGDKYLLTAGNKKNHQFVNEAIQKSAGQVYDAFKNPSKAINANEVINIMPFVDASAVNNAPLFQMKDGQLLRRLDVGNLVDQKTKSNWWGIPTATLNLVQGETRQNSALPPSSQA